MSHSFHALVENTATCHVWKTAWLCLLSSTPVSPVADASSGQETRGMRHARWRPPCCWFKKPLKTLDISYQIRSYRIISTAKIQKFQSSTPYLASKLGTLCKITKPKASVQKELPSASVFSKRRLLGLRRRCGSQVPAHGTHT